jgi:hypothetical protein
VRLGLEVKAQKLRKSVPARDYPQMVRGKTHRAIVLVGCLIENAYSHAPIMASAARARRDFSQIIRF